MTLPDKYYGEQNFNLAKTLLDKQGEINSLRATIARVKDANDNMRTWCSPYGFVVRCAEHIDKALAGPAQQQGDTT